MSPFQAAPTPIGGTKPIVIPDSDTEPNWHRSTLTLVPTGPNLCLSRKQGILSYTDPVGILAGLDPYRHKPYEDSLDQEDENWYEQLADASELDTSSDTGLVSPPTVTKKKGAP